MLIDQLLDGKYVPTAWRNNAPRGTGAWSPRSVGPNAQSCMLGWYAWQDSNLRPLGPQPNALSPELQARIAHFTPERQRPAVAGRPGREGRDSNPRSAFSALNRLAGGPIRPLWHLPRWLCPRLASGVACTGFQTEKFTTEPVPSLGLPAGYVSERPHHARDPRPRWPWGGGAHCSFVAEPASGGGTRSRDASS
jgi:hypothetical protein